MPISKFVPICSCRVLKALYKLLYVIKTSDKTNNKHKIIEKFTFLN